LSGRVTREGSLWVQAQINEDSAEQVLQVEQRYNAVRRPVYEKRAQMIAELPQFWATCFAQHGYFADILSDADLEVLAFLQQLDVVDNADIKSGFRIIFTWAENPYFTNQTLTKTFTFTSDSTQQVKGTRIDWKEKMVRSSFVLVALESGLGHALNTDDTSPTFPEP
jgi:template-activating factor I